MPSVVDHQGSCFHPVAGLEYAIVHPGRGFGRIPGHRMLAGCLDRVDQFGHDPAGRIVDADRGPGGRREAVADGGAGIGGIRIRPEVTDRFDPLLVLDTGQDLDIDIVGGDLRPRVASAARRVVVQRNR